MPNCAPPRGGCNCGRTRPDGATWTRPARPCSGWSAGPGGGGAPSPQGRCRRRAPGRRGRLPTRAVESPLPRLPLQLGPGPCRRRRRRRPAPRRRPAGATWPHPRGPLRLARWPRRRRRARLPRPPPPSSPWPTWLPLASAEAPPQPRPPLQLGPCLCRRCCRRPALRRRHQRPP